MCGARPLAFREAAHRVGRDVQSLLAAGVFRRTPEGDAVARFAAVAVAFPLHAASLR